VVLPFGKSSEDGHSGFSHSCTRFYSFRGTKGLLGLKAVAGVISSSVSSLILSSVNDVFRIREYYYFYSFQSNPDNSPHQDQIDAPCRSVHTPRNSREITEHRFANEKHKV
jgi:hypothetical protein